MRGITAAFYICTIIFILTALSALLGVGSAIMIGDSTLIGVIMLITLPSVLFSAWIAYAFAGCKSMQEQLKL